MTLQDLEHRVAKLERTVAELTATQVPPRSGKWYVEHAGQFRGDKVYAEIVRRGREYRRSLRPDRRGGKRR